MAAVAVEIPPPAIVGFNEKANVFIAEIEVPASTTGPIAPAPKKDKVPVFVLNSSDFVNLQLYLQSGLKLPSSTELFESTYPKAAFDQYLTKDPTLYDGLKSHLPKIHTHCRDFQGKTVGPMINVGGYISDFAEDAANHTQEIRDNLTLICKPTTKAGDDVDTDAKAAVKSSLRKLTKYSESTEQECKGLSVELSEFKTLTESDQIELKGLCTRFNTNIPNETEREKDLQSLMKKSKDTLTALRSQAEETHNAAIEKGKDKWYYYIPIIGACILIYDRIKQKGLLETLSDLNKKYNDERAKGEHDALQLTIAFNQINALSGGLMDVEKTIQGAINAVGNMQTAFSNLATDFKKLRTRLEDVEGDIDEERMAERVTSFKDLDKAIETWESVKTLAKVFQLHGTILAAQDALLPKKE